MSIAISGSEGLQAGVLLSFSEEDCLTLLVGDFFRVERHWNDAEIHQDPAWDGLPQLYLTF